MKKHFSQGLALLLLLSSPLLLTGCLNTNCCAFCMLIENSPYEGPIQILMPESPCNTVFQQDDLYIDVSNVQDGYVCIRFFAQDKQLKTLIECPSSTEYIYDLNNAGEPEYFPLSEGSGNYIISIWFLLSEKQY